MALTVVFGIVTAVRHFTSEVAYGAVARETPLMATETAATGDQGEVLVLVVIRRGPVFPHEVLGIGGPVEVAFTSTRTLASNPATRNRGADEDMTRSLDDAWYVANNVLGTPVAATRWTHLDFIPEDTRAYQEGLRTDDHVVGFTRNDEGLVTGVELWREDRFEHIELSEPLSDNALLVGSYIFEHVRLPDGRPSMRQNRDLTGSSAGVAHVLEYLDAMTPGDLTGGLRLAVTGQITPDGNVVGIGGMTNKTEAAIAAGADVILVPEANLDEARGAADGRVKVVAIASVTNALRWICLAGSSPACDLVS